jgi:hypothetical protein
MNKKLQSISLVLFLVCANCYSQTFQEITTTLPNVNAGEAAWGDYDNDGDLDILITGNDLSYNRISRVYQNAGGGVFNHQTQISLQGVTSGTSDWIDYDNDGDLDIMITGSGSDNVPLSRIYKNNGDNTFTEQSTIILANVRNSSVVWGDYNNDGDPDVLFIGYNEYNNRVVKLFRNNGNYTFTEQTGIGLAEVSDGSAAFGDYDKDGDQDIVLSGSSGLGLISKVYRNNGDNSFSEQAGISLTGAYSGSVTWSDYNNDGYLDILITGYTDSGVKISELYKNNGNNTFTKQNTVALTAVSYGSLAWGDYDNDGDQDLLLTGQVENNTGISKLFKNNGNNSFTEQTAITLTGMSNGTAEWGDYDNDGDLDILMTGYYTATHSPLTRLYRNNGSTFNTKPTTPGGLVQSVSGNKANLSWNISSDTQTPQTGLSYNLYVSTSPSGNNIKSPNASVPSGLRKITETGEIHNNQYTISNLNAGTYYWSVQAIDAALAGSAFASEGSFTVSLSNSISPVDDQYLAPGKNGNVITVSEAGIPDSRQWMYSKYPGGPYNRVLTGETATTYVPKIISDSLMYVVCVSVKNGISVTSNEVKIELFRFDEQTAVSIPGISHGSLAWGDYDNDEDLDILISGFDISLARVSKVFRNNGNNSFTEQTGISLTGVYYGSSDWIDYDNDGDLDIMITGRDISNTNLSRIYKNNGDNTFTWQTGIIFPGVYYSSVSWGDYDNDGDQDLLLTGRDQSNTRISKIYKNAGNNSFIEQTGIIITPVDIGDCSWADYDIDGDLDILLTGYNVSSGSVSKIFRNNGDNTFTEQTGIILTGVYYSSVSWGDYNNDEYPDILLTGYNSVSGQRLSKIYKNNGGTSFTEQTGIQLTAVNMGSAEWGDFNNDGNLDILLSGYTVSGIAISEIYRNDKNNNFVKQKSNSFTGVYYSKLLWADYDNDKDLDILLSGYTGTTSLTKIYRNICDIPNTAPGPPKGLDITRNGTNVTFSWTYATDKETRSQGLSYNIRIGTKSDSSDVKSASASVKSGYHYLVGNGNVGHIYSWTIKDLPQGSYYWSVQAIDHGYLSSEFAPEETFENYFAESGYSYSGSGKPYLGDYDRDGDLDILAPGNNMTTVYRNDLSSGLGFSDISAGMARAGDAAFAWGDYDNDGDLDIAFNGYQGLFFTKIYRNDNGAFIDINAVMQGTWMGTLAWGDYDNDGDLDLFVYGNHEYSDDGEPIGILYRNDGNDKFTNSEIVIEDARRGNVALADYNKDGYIDILTCGFNLSTNLFTSILKNNRDNTFTNINAGLVGYSYGDMCWGDYDSDGDLDICITGRLLDNNDNSTRIYQNQGNETFKDIGLLLPGPNSYSTTAEWGDYDNDGDLDLLVSMEKCIIRNDGNNKFTPLDIGIDVQSCTFGDIDNDGDLDIVSASSILLNNRVIHNSGPVIPNGLQTKVSGNQVIMNWNLSSDATTPANAITYNVCVGTSPGVWNVLSPMVDSNTGSRKSVTGMGNAMTNNFKILKGLPVGTYYWAVQAVDNGYMTSGFSSVQSFEILPMFTELLPNTNGIWGDYDNDGDLDFLEQQSTTLAIFRNGGNDNFSENIIKVSQGYTVNEKVSWGDFDNDGDLDIITSDSIFRNDQNNIFTNSGIHFQSPSYEIITGDYDADGDLDILAKINEDSKDKSVIYRNDRNNIFTRIDLQLVTDNWIENLSWLDYDSDGDLDILLIFGSYLQLSTQIFRNDGNNNFTNIYADLAGLNYSAISYADYDNDNDLDILLVGRDNDYNNQSRIYRNEGNDMFTDINTNIRGYWEPSLFWGDHNNDGFMDVLISGDNNGRVRNKLYQNNHDGSFTELDVDNIVEYIKILSCGDYDNDGDLDAITGSGIFRNNTNPQDIKPQTVTNLNSDLKGLNCLLSWEGAKDAKGVGYSYNIRIGITPTGCEIKSPKSPPGFGNVPVDTSWLIRNLTPGLYYWSVQAINQTYSAGPWAPVKSFLITNVSPDFSYNTVCYGSNTIFTDLSVTSDVIVKWKWNFGDGDISYQRHPSHLYKTAGTFNVSLWAFSQSGDSAERVRQVIVKPSPYASFSVSPVCKDTPSVLENHSIVNNITVSSWVWDFGNGDFSSVQNSVQKTYPRSDTAILTIIAGNGCWDADTQFVAVAEYPNANLYLSPGYSNVFCSGDSSILVVTDNDNYNYRWKLNGVNILGASGSVLSTKGPGGEYSIEVENPVAGCISTSSLQITVNAAPSSPTISYSGNPDLLCEGDSILLSVPYTAGYKYNWKLNGGDVGTNSNQLRAKNSGLYNVVVLNSTGCNVTSMNTINVVVKSLPSITAVSLSGPAAFCQGGSVTLSIPSAAGYNYNWRNEFGLIYGADKNSFTADTSGTYQLEISNTEGCKVRTSPVTVVENPSPYKPAIESFNYEPGKCPGENIIRLNATQSVTQYQYQWYKDGLPLLNKTLSNIELYEQGNYKLEAAMGGCKSESDIFIINFPEAPEMPFIHVQGPTVWYLACSNPNASKYKWYCNDKLIEEADKYYYVANRRMGDYQVIVGNDKGCYTRSDIVTIPTGTTGIDDIDPFNGLMIYPNPSRGLFALEMDNNVFGEIMIKVISQDGKEILTLKFEKTAEYFSGKIDLTGQPQGIYIINMMIDKYLITKKLIIE